MIYIFVIFLSFYFCLFVDDDYLNRHLFLFLPNFKQQIFILLLNCLYINNNKIENK